MRPVTLNRLNVPPMDWMELLLISVKPGALWATRSPVISVGPLISIVPTADESMTRVPLTVVHAVYAWA